MAKYYIYHNPQRCIGCLACELSCTDWKGLPFGQANCRIFRFGPEKIHGKESMTFIYNSCFHCERAFCTEACPTGALFKRKEDGIVAFNENLCIGCRACIMACPWGIPQWNSLKGTIHKCDYCVERLEEGLEPACVTRCPMEALKFVKVEEVSKLKRTSWLKDTFKKEVAHAAEF
ncbi:4Fe-4S dicluster domain-containing protein [Thermodesulfatator autotrophicus]|uniref:4Fe-4S ferredoxin n=1 Tax=Thermodesulfatator autotrophicus TaxID=1795632 RepID=A0A177E7P0_9BACT|nr:4Fe-4S dicluster domain-containing protein [Thermodesulfatator autotrophicus]OAG27726.1 4Fe-4S ferredoxin [Thermodesulfatator autotrophicus]